jgi:hypothetical protein
MARTASFGNELTPILKFLHNNSLFKVRSEALPSGLKGPLQVPITSPSLSAYRKVELRHEEGDEEITSRFEVSLRKHGQNEEVDRGLALPKWDIPFVFQTTSGR